MHDKDYIISQLIKSNNALAKSLEEIRGVYTPSNDKQDTAEDNAVKALREYHRVKQIVNHTPS